VGVLDDVSRSAYISLTTYRRDGTAVPTPVWHARNGSDLLVITGAETGKVKRIRRDGRVLVTVCDFRGRIAPGAPSAEGTARVLGEAETQTARALIARKYVLSRLGNWLTRILHLRRRPVVGIAVTLDPGRV
jgi:PPOX class probable F420-dependent enzyme